MHMLDIGYLPREILNDMLFTRSRNYISLALMFSISRKVLRNVTSSTSMKEQVSALAKRISDAKESGNYSEVTSYLRNTLPAGKSSAIRIPFSGTELPLPAYLARTNRVPLLRQLLDDDVISFSADDVSADDMWEHINVTKADIPHVCAIMEKFGDQLHGPCSVYLSMWLQSHLMIVPALTEALSTVPCPYPHLARAVVEVTPINSQAVTIAAKHDMFDWLRKNAHRLAAAHPEGYASWGVLFDHLVSQGGLTTRVCIALKALVAGWENTSMQNSAVSDAFWKASAQEYLVSTPPVSIADTCTGLECVGSDLQSRGEELLRWFSRKLSDDGRSELISELCQGAYPHLARAVACCFLDAYTVHSVSIAVHYGFADILKERVQDPDRSHVINSPGVNPKSPHRLSKNDNANAWLWLFKGDGDVTKKMWDMIVELKLISDSSCDYDDFLAGVYRSGAKINVDSFNPPRLRRMIGEVHVDALKCLVESGVDIISLCPTALHHARDLDTAKYLVQCGATLCADENGRTPLHWAKSADVVDFLIEMGADVSAVNDAGKTPLHCTAYIDVAKSLIAHKADIHARDNDGKTPLHSVYSDGIVQLLINHKADVSALDNTGKTPLHYLKYGDSVEILVENGADIEAVDEEGRTPFMAAFCGTHPYLYSYYECFHRCGANPNAVDANGRTALHSLSREFSCYVSILVEMKADPNARDNDGKTPLDLAVDSSVISQLKLVGARFSASNNMTLNEKKQGAGEVEVGRG